MVAQSTDRVATIWPSRSSGNGTVQGDSCARTIMTVGLDDCYFQPWITLTQIRRCPPWRYNSNSRFLFPFVFLSFFRLFSYFLTVIFHLLFLCYNLISSCRFVRNPHFLFLLFSPKMLLPSFFNFNNTCWS